MADIFIVEDDLDLVETYADLLEANGHSVVCASQISEATAYVIETRPDIITLDLNLPGNSSAAITAFIHGAKAIGESKLIVISGHPEMILGHEWMDQVDLVLTKPVDNEHLLIMIERLLFLPKPEVSAAYARK